MQDLEIIRKIINKFFEKTTFKVNIDFLLEEGKTIIIKLKAEEPQILIGEDGQVLKNIQYILKMILKRKIENHFYLDLDINDYKKQKIEFLKNRIYLIADKVSLTKKEKELIPMPAYERRVVHLALAEREDIITESIGEGNERRIVIKPK